MDQVNAKNPLCSIRGSLRELLFGPFLGGKILKSNLNEYSSQYLKCY